MLHSIASVVFFTFALLHCVNFLFSFHVIVLCIMNVVLVSVPANAASENADGFVMVMALRSLVSK